MNTQGNVEDKESLNSDNFPKKIKGKLYGDKGAFGVTVGKRNKVADKIFLNHPEKDGRYFPDFNNS